MDSGIVAELAALSDRLDCPVGDAYIGAGEAVRTDDCPAAHDQIKHAISDARLPAMCIRNDTGC